MQIVIDIDEKVKRYLDQTTTSDMEDHYVKHFSLWIAKAIKEGTILPTGHGDLISRSAIAREILPLVDFETRMYVSEKLHVVPTVIPSDKGEE